MALALSQVVPALRPWCWHFAHGAGALPLDAGALPIVQGPCTHTHTCSPMRTVVAGALDSSGPRCRNDASFRAKSAWRPSCQIARRHRKHRYKEEECSFWCCSVTLSAC